MHHRRILGAFVALLTAPTILGGQTDNLGFDRPSSRDSTTPAGWRVSGEGYEIRLDPTTKRSGSASLRVRHVTGEGNFGFAGGSMSLSQLLGRTVRYSGYIKTDSIRDGWAGLWMRVDGADSVLAFDNMESDSVRGTTDWARYEVVLPVHPCATGIAFGVLHPGDGTAWFDDLAVESEVIETDDDADESSCADPEDESWIEWAREHSLPLSSLTSDDFTDLGQLSSIFSQKRIVQLGESGHGVAQFNLAKVRFIKFLHEELDFDVIAFESSVYECYRAYEQVESLDAEALMRHCIFGVWHTDEVLPLFEYIKSTASTSDPLILAGFDTQISSRVGVQGRPEFLAEVIGSVDTAYARRVFAFDSAFVAVQTGSGQGGEVQTFLDSNGVSLRASYDLLIAFIDEHRRELGVATGDPARVTVARQTAWSMIRFIRQLTTQFGADRTLARDSGMAVNLMMLADELYPDDRIITWGHNFHLRHRNAAIPGEQSATMGTWVAERFGTDVYTVGLYMADGSAALNNRETYTIDTPRTGSMESVLSQTGNDMMFLDFEQVEQTSANEWLFAPIRNRSWGTNYMRMILAEQYNGILFIQSVTPPNYRPR